MTGINLWLTLAAAGLALAAGIFARRRGHRAAAWGLLACAPVALGVAVSMARHATPPDAADVMLNAATSDPWGAVGKEPGTAAAPMAGAAGAQPQAGSIEEATARLAARLAKEPNDASGWALLAQSYEYLGKSQEAAAARAKATALGATVPPLPAGSGMGAAAGPLSPAAMAAHAKAGVQMPGSAAAMAGALPQAPVAAREPTTANDWWAKGVEQRRLRNFPAAAEAFRRATLAAPKSADAWADYADALAANNGGDLSRGKAALDRALALDPRHVKALWLRASLQLQQRDYAAAANTWQAMLNIVPAQSSDAKIIRANLEEARALAAGKS